MFRPRSAGICREHDQLLIKLLWVVFPMYVGLVAILSLVPRGPELAVGGDKLAHFGAYLVMALLGMPLTRGRRRAMGMFLFVVAVGASMVGVQAFTPDRLASGWDMVANLSGATSGTLVWRGAVRIRQRIL